MPSHTEFLRDLLLPLFLLERTGVISLENLSPGQFTQYSMCFFILQFLISIFMWKFAFGSSRMNSVIELVLISDDDTIT